MDAPEPENTPFAAVSAQTSKLGRVRYSTNPTNPSISQTPSFPSSDLLTPSPLFPAIPILPRQKHPIHLLPMDQHRRPPRPLLRPHSRSARMVHRYVTPLNSSAAATLCKPGAKIIQKRDLTSYSLLLPRNLPPEPLPRLPATENRPFPHPRRRPRGRRRRQQPAHQKRRGVPTLHPPVTGIQVLAFGHAGHRH